MWRTGIIGLRQGNEKSKCGTANPVLPTGAADDSPAQFSSKARIETLQVLETERSEGCQHGPGRLEGQFWASVEGYFTEGTLKKECRNGSGKIRRNLVLGKGWE